MINNKFVFLLIQMSNVNQKILIVLVGVGSNKTRRSPFDLPQQEDHRVGWFR